jgi:hypothetical protein
MRKKLHPLVLTIAIFQVVFGVLGLGCDGFGLINAVGLMMMNPSATPPPTTTTKTSGKGQPPTPGEAFERGAAAGTEAEMTVLKKAPIYAPVQLVHALFGLFLVLLMIVSGLGLFFMQSWARWLAVGYGVLSILTRCVCLGYHAALVLPIYNEVGQAFIQSGNPDMDNNLWLLKYGPFMALLLGLYPLLVIVLLLLPQVGQAFRAEPAANAGFDDYRDRGDDRDRYPGGDRYQNW